jgi:hypothetical protein
MMADNPGKTRAELEQERRNMLGLIFRTQPPETHTPETRAPQTHASETRVAETQASEVYASEAHAPEERPAPIPPPMPPAIASARRTPAPAARPGGGILYLCTLALVGAAIVGVFFGLGVVLLMQHPAARADREAPSATSARVLASASETQLPGPPAVKAPALAKTNLPAPPQEAGAMPGPPQRTPASKPPAVATTPAPAPSGLPNRSTTLSATTSVPAGALPERASKVPTASPPAASQPLSTTEIAALLAHGDALFHSGEFPAARRLYQQALDAGAGRGALGLGATYDPSFLNRDHRHGLRGDPAIAGFWYRSALALGEPEAEGRLATLGAEK